MHRTTIFKGCAEFEQNIAMYKIDGDNSYSILRCILRVLVRHFLVFDQII